MFANERMLGVAARWGDYALDLVVARAPRIANGGEVSCGKSDELTVPMLASCGCLTPMAKLCRTRKRQSSDAARGIDEVRHVSACDLW